MLEAISKNLYYPPFFGSSKQSAYSLAARVAKPALALLFTVSIIALVAYRRFVPSALPPRLEKEEHKEKSLFDLFDQGQERFADSAWKEEYLKDHHLPDLNEVMCDCKENGTQLKDHPRKKLRDYLLKKRGENPIRVMRVNQRVSNEGYFTIYLEIGIDRFQECLNQIGISEEEKKEIWATVAKQYVSYKFPFNSKEEHKEKSLFDLFDQGQERFADSAWKEEYLKDHYLPDLKEVIRECKENGTQLQDHPRKKLRDYLLKKRGENPIRVMRVNQRVSNEDYFTIYLEIGIDRFQECLNQIGISEKEKKWIWATVAKQYVIYKFPFNSDDVGFDKEMLKFAENGVDFHKVDTEIRAHFKDKIPAGYFPSLFFGLYFFGKKTLLIQLVQKRYINYKKLIHPDDLEVFRRLQHKVIKDYAYFAYAFYYSPLIAALAAQFSFPGGGESLRGRGIPSEEG